MPEPLLNAREVRALLRVSMRTLYRWRHRPDFPEPLKLGPRSHRWRQSDIMAWIEKTRGGE